MELVMYWCIFLCAFRVIICSLYFSMYALFFLYFKNLSFVGLQLWSNHLILSSLRVLVTHTSKEHPSYSPICSKYLQQAQFPALRRGGYTAGPEPLGLNSGHIYRAATYSRLLNFCLLLRRLGIISTYLLFKNTMRHTSTRKKCEIRFNIIVFVLFARKLYHDHLNSTYFWARTKNKIDILLKETILHITISWVAKLIVQYRNIGRRKKYHCYLEVISRAINIIKILKYPVVNV
eukprot:GEMP01076549.1.p1 GENE.GEMP01076549.1~~GEMP01076549.1.p1  ORF type:complete len:234 (+),score=-27.53 GEMP01076549.1:76-777(+)